MNVPRSCGRFAWALVPLATCLVWSDPVPPPLPPPLSVPPRPGVIATVKPTNGPALVVPLTNRPLVPAGAPTAVSQPGKPGVFVFDATNKTVELNAGEQTAAFVFAVTNISPEEVTISYINTSCGCTAGKLPSYPWKLKPGEGGHIDVSMNVAGKFGVVTKTATVVSSAGSYALMVTSKIPQAAATATGATGDRSRNMQIATADRQAVFRNDCASCHVQPTIGKSGKDLYETACGICHEAEHQATMVPNLRTRLANTDRNYWSKWISEGRQGSLMPAFSAKLGGILSDEQIASLVVYLEDVYKKDPPPSKTITSASTPPVPAVAVPVPVGTSKGADR